MKRLAGMAVCGLLCVFCTMTGCKTRQVVTIQAPVMRSVEPLSLPQPPSPVTATTTVPAQPSTPASTPPQVPKTADQASSIQSDALAAELQKFHEQHNDWPKDFREFDGFIRGRQKERLLQAVLGMTFSPQADGGVVCGARFRIVQKNMIMELDREIRIRFVEEIGGIPLPALGGP